MTQRKFIDQDHFAERVAIKLESIRNPTPRQVHDAENQALREFRELYGEIEIAQWPSVQPAENVEGETNRRA